MAVLGITAMIYPIEVIDSKFLSNDVIFMVAFALIVLPLVLISKSKTLNYKQGILLLAAYTFFIYSVL